VASSSAPGEPAQPSVTETATRSATRRRRRRGARAAPPAPPCGSEKFPRTSRDQLRKHPTAKPLTPGRHGTAAEPPRGPPVVTRGTLPLHLGLHLLSCAAVQEGRPNPLPPPPLYARLARMSAAQASRAKVLSPVAQRRLSRELGEWTVKEPPVPGMAVRPTQRLDEWMVDVQGAEGSVYAGERYQLRFIFPTDYPMEAPEVIFLQPTPRHPHVYSNGHSKSLRWRGESRRSGARAPLCGQAAVCLCVKTDPLTRFDPHSLSERPLRWLVSCADSNVRLPEPGLHAEQRKGEGRPERQ
jgi:hypothetical protein